MRLRMIIIPIIHIAYLHYTTTISHIDSHHVYDAFTLSANETETDTDKKYREPNGNLCCHLSLCSVNTPIRFCTNHFLSVSLSVSFSGSVNAHYILLLWPLATLVHITYTLIFVLELFSSSTIHNIHNILYHSTKRHHFFCFHYVRHVVD